MSLLTLDCEYMQTGLEYDSAGKVLRVDLNTPRTIRVEGVNELTGEKRDYLLEVTSSGKLILQ